MHGEKSYLKIKESYEQKLCEFMNRVWNKCENEFVWKNCTWNKCGKKSCGGKSFMEKNYKQINDPWKITQKLKADMINELCLKKHCLWKISCVEKYMKNKLI